MDILSSFPAISSLKLVIITNISHNSILFKNISLKETLLCSWLSSVEIGLINEFLSILIKKFLNILYDVIGSFLTFISRLLFFGLIMSSLNLHLEPVT